MEKKTRVRDTESNALLNAVIYWLCTSACRLQSKSNEGDLNEPLLDEDDDDDDEPDALLEAPLLDGTLELFVTFKLLEFDRLDTLEMNAIASENSHFMKKSSICESHLPQ